jgi:hypothetical protein
MNMLKRYEKEEKLKIKTLGEMHQTFERYKTSLHRTDVQEQELCPDFLANFPALYAT